MNAVPASTFKDLQGAIFPLLSIHVITRAQQTPRRRKYRIIQPSSEKAVKVPYNNHAASYE